MGRHGKVGISSNRVCTFCKFDLEIVKHSLCNHIVVLCDTINQKTPRIMLRSFIRNTMKHIDMSLIQTLSYCLYLGYMTLYIIILNLYYNRFINIVSISGNVLTLGNQSWQLLFVAFGQ